MYSHHTLNVLPDKQRPRWACVLLMLLTFGAASCASIPKRRYGVASLEVEGAERLDEQALKACLATRAREKPQFDISRNPSPTCGEEPFDADHVLVPFWPTSWPWSEWPLFDRAIFQRDVERIERWYRARGYYDARVLSTEVDPPEAAAGTAGFGGCGEDEACKVRVRLQVEEGQPVRVSEIRIISHQPLSEKVEGGVRNALFLERGAPFDESLYDESKESLLRILRDSSYAKARISGNVRVNPQTREAQVTFEIFPGPSCTFGDVQVRVGDAKKISKEVVLHTANLLRGQPFSVTAIEEAQRAIYALGAFSSVEVEPDTAAPGRDIPVLIEVVPGRLFRWGVGAGIMSGLITRLEGYSAQEVRQWDVHLLGFAEFRNAFGGLQRVRIEERPKLVIRNQFPSPGEVLPGNVLTVDSRWPDFLEGRTSLVAGAQWDVGPDLFGRPFQRDAIDARVGPQRSWSTLGGTVFSTVAAHYNMFFPFDDQGFDADRRTAGVQQLQSYRVLFLESYANLDLRDDSTRATRGLFTDLSIHTAGLLPEVSFWTYVRVVPDVRFYVPLPLGIVFATRLRLGIMHIVAADSGLDPAGERLGPYSYRLRGGGSNSNRGFVPGYLGDGVEGGLRRWETSAELRISLSENFGVVLFSDAGDVIDNTQFRFDRPQVSMGMGLRYQTIVGPLRFDVGYRVPGLQTLGDAVLRRQPFDLDLGLFRIPGAYNLTIGEAF